MAKAALKVLTVEERTEKSKHLRNKGITPGVIYGEGIETGISIQFDMPKLKHILKSNFMNAKLTVKLGEAGRFCLIKDFQTDPVSGNIIHVDFQSVSADEVIKLKVPIIFNGKAALKLKRLALQINVTELEIEGRVDLVPEAIHIDVSTRNVGDKIILKELELESHIKVHADENEILAFVVEPREAVAEPVEAEEEVATSTEKTEAKE